MNSPRSKANHRILVVDDNPTIHADFRKILCPDQATRSEMLELEAALFNEPKLKAETSCFEVASAYQGREALTLVETAVAERRPYALAFVDVRMPPGWDGVETIARLWTVDPDLQVVVCTAYADYSWEELRAKVGQPDNLLVLKKPFDNVEVQQLAHALTKKWQLNLQAGLKMAELQDMVRQRTAELQEAIACLRLSEERFSKAFQANPVPSGILTLADQRFVDANHRLVELTGCRREDLLGRSPADLFLWEDPAQADRWIKALLHKEVVRDQEAKIRHQSGTPREVLVSLTAIELGGQPHLLLLLQDVSERNLLERQFRQAQKMEAIGQLAAGVAHDFNNILTVIQGHAGLLQQVSAPGGPAARSTDQILKASTRASTFVRQLLMFSRKQVMRFRNVDLNETLRNAVTMLRHLVGEHVELEFRPTHPLPAIYADTSMIEQIAMNLAVNARDAMPNGGGITILTAAVTLHRAPTPLDPEPRDGEFVCLTFTDSGTGMDTEILTRIFEPFFTTKAVGKGTGLGLSTVFGIVRQHHGWLEVESRPNRGTTFRAYFPALAAPAEKLESLPDNLPRGGPETVLVVEDEDALREMVVQILSFQGYKVLEARSGRHALEVWDSAPQHIDLLVTDMVMPEGILGAELAERLLQRDPHLKVIYTSGYSPGMAGKDISLLEGRNFLPKPYSLEKLAQFVRACLDTPPTEHDPKANT